MLVPAGHSLKDMYNAGAIALFWLVGTFSGAWPYTKLLALLYCWLAPPAGLSAETRGGLLLLLDRLGAHHKQSKLCLCLWHSSPSHGGTAVRHTSTTTTCAPPCPGNFCDETDCVGGAGLRLVVGLGLLDCRDMEPD